MDGKSRGKSVIFGHFGTFDPFWAHTLFFYKNKEISSEAGIVLKFEAHFLKVHTYPYPNYLLKIAHLGPICHLKMFSSKNN